MVKGVRFIGLRDAGDPACLAARYDREGADEIVVLDVAASRDGRRTFLATIERAAEGLTIPLIAGGGIRALTDARAVVAAGADKVAVNTAAIERPELLGELADAFGVQAVVLAVDVKRRAAGWQVFARGGREPTRLEAVAWASRGVRAGAGEILLTSIDRDGTGEGFDVELTRALVDGVGVPVIASGGARRAEDFVDVLRDGGADAALAASIFHDARVSIAEVKARLARAGVPVRRDP